MMLSALYRKIKRLLSDPPKILPQLFVHGYNALFVSRAILPSVDFQPLDEIIKKSERNSDIKDHLVRIFREALSARPKLIVELGVRGGESTFVFERAARLIDARLISLDLKDRTKIISWDKWLFVKGDDIEFAGQFVRYCREHNIQPSIDVLFIDTSHFYEHTKLEIQHWFPLLSDTAKVMFHDTNLRRMYRRRDGSLVVGWDNKRGVIRAIEEYLGAHFDETREFTDFKKNFLVTHVPYCNGFTILEKISVQHRNG